MKMAVFCQFSSAR